MTKTPTITTATVELAYGRWVELHQLLKNFVSNDESRGVLTAVRIVNHDGHLRFQATDSYKLLDLHTRFETSSPVEVLVPWMWIGAMLRIIRARSLFVRLTVDNGRVTLSNGDETFSCAWEHADQAFPNVDNLVNVTPAVQLEAAAFDPLNLHVLTDALIRMNGTIQLVQMTKLKPTIVAIRAVDGDYYGHAVLMPVRLP
jgi:hypothetical protein